MKKKIIFFFIFLLLTSSTKIFSQKFEENFEYPAGDTITEHGWITISGAGVNPITVKDPGLEFPCYVGSGLGGTATLQTTGEDVYRFLNRKLTTGSVYTAFMVKVYSAQDGDFFFHLSDSSANNSEKIGRVWAKASNGNIAFGLSKDSEDPIYTPGQYLINVTYLMVLKYTFVPGSQNDLVRLYIFSPPNCPPSIEPVTATLGPIGVGEDDLTNYGKLVLQQGAGGHAAFLQLDGIYVLNNWDNGALPVELSAFSSSVNKRDATLYWTTVSESNNSGFNVERKLISSGEWITAGNVTGNGTSNVSHDYTFTDKNLVSGKYNYRLKQIDFNGNFEYHNLNAEVEIGAPTKFDLSQNYPNPFNPSTMINYELSKAGFVSIKVFDNLGKEVATLVNESMNEGYYSINFDGANLPSGLYYYKMETAGFTKVMKMTLLK